jgi:dephospho-CoA kinase
MTQTIVGLTGSIGMGKSTTASMFAELGIPVWDADAAVHRIYGAKGPGGPVLRDLVPQAVRPDGSVNRDALKAAIAKNPEVLGQLEQRIHPLVANDRAEFLATHARASIVVLDIPLLFETNGTDLVDRIAVVTTTADNQRRRVLDRPGMDEDTFTRLLARQTPDAEKRARADFVIRSDDLATARKDVEHLLNALRAEAKHA